MVPGLWLLLAGCRIEVGAPTTGVGAAATGPAGEVWIYTSMYQSVIDAIDPQIRAAYPGIETKWFQAGSEKVAQRIEAEWAAGSSPACLVMTSDPFWYVELTEAGRLQPHLPPTALQVDRALVDPNGFWLASRLSMMVLASRAEVKDRPSKFSDLADPRWRDRATMGDPLASGTVFTAIAYLAPGDLLDRMHHNGVVASGGNSAVVGRLESGEKDVGLVLLENVLTARRKGSLIEAIFPEDGAVVIPGPIAMTAACPNPAAAGLVYDFLMSEPAQRAFAAGDMYPVLPSVPGPAGAPPLADVVVRPWAPGFAATVVRDKAALKERWTRLGEAK